jgi:hypothetical protein
MNSHVSGLLLQRCELLDRTLNICLEYISIKFKQFDVIAYLGQLFSFGKLFVNFLGEVLVRLKNLAVGHDSECDNRKMGV